MRRLIVFLDPLILGVILGMVFVAMTNPSASLLGKVAEEREVVKEPWLRIMSGARALQLAPKVALPLAWIGDSGTSVCPAAGESRGRL